MRLVCISDMHLKHGGLSLPAGDVLICAGDGSYAGQGTLDWLLWLAQFPHRHKLVVGGNHDDMLERDAGMAARLRPHGITYLQDDGVEIGGLKFWGAPWLPRHRPRGAFCLPRNGERLADAWARIPLDTDVLITHAPPLGILDQCSDQIHAGCGLLRRRLALVSPRVHVFGHIHGPHGVVMDGGTAYVNATICDYDLAPVRRPVELVA